MYGLMPIVQAVLLSVVSFFVLVAVTKTESKNLQKFGRLLACALWTIAVVMVVSTFFFSGTSKRGLMYKCPLGQKMMKCR